MRLILSVFTLALSVGATPVSAQCRLVGSDTLQYDSFGESVAVEDDVLVVGAWRNDGAGSQAGAVYVYGRNGNAWSEEQILYASDASVDGYFGHRVALSGDVLVVGTRGWYDTTGSVYVFHKSGGVWSEVQKLDPPGNDDGDFFGGAVAVDGDAILVGSPGDDTVAYTAGRVYVYERLGSTWVLTDELNNGGYGARCGEDVAIDGDLMVMGTRNLSAHVYRRSAGTWALEQSVYGSKDFGTAVDIDGDVLVVGEPKEVPHAYVYRYGGGSWSLEADLTRPNPYRFDRFGSAIAVDGDRIAVGASNAMYLGATGHGVVHHFEFSGGSWSHENALEPEIVENYSGFGRNLALDGDLTLVATSKDYALLDFPGAGALVLDASVVPVSGGSNVSVLTASGAAFTPCFLALVGLNGAPRFQRVFLGSFDATGEHQIGGFVSDVFAGTVLDLQSFGVDVCGRVGASNIDSITLQ